MILILDNLINNYLNILSCFSILLLPNLNKDKIYLFIIIDIFLNKIPYISLIMIILYIFDKFIYKIVYKNKINILFISILNYIAFISILYFIYGYNFSYLFYLKSNILSFIFNIIIYYLYIFLNN